VFFCLTKQTHVVDLHTSIVNAGSCMTLPKLTRLEMHIMEALWSRGPSSIREIQEGFPERVRPAYTTVQTTVYRMERKRVLRRLKKISNAHIFEAVISRDAAHGRLIDDLLGMFGGRTQPVMAHLIETGKLTLDDVREAEKVLRRLARKENQE
jgi:BlaI family transcriptional regulator, penicillinase repressor